MPPCNEFGEKLRVNSEKVKKTSPKELVFFGAGDRGRTCMSETLDPKSSASANSATPAYIVRCFSQRTYYTTVFDFCQYLKYRNCYSRNNNYGTKQSQEDILLFIYYSTH